MRTFNALLRRELGSYLLSFPGYALAACVVLLCGFSILDIAEKANKIATDAPVVEVFYSSYYYWLILLLTTPVITMRSFAFEKSTGTYETLMTAPVGDASVVFAKFTGALIFFLMIWLPVLGMIMGMHRFMGLDSMLPDPATMGCTVLGVALIGSVYVSMGCFASALSGSQLMASAVSYALGLALFVLSLRSMVAMPAPGWVSEIFSHISITEHMGDFARGIIDTGAVVLHLSLTTVFLFLCIRVVEARRWK